MDLLIEARP